MQKKQGVPKAYEDSAFLKRPNARAIRVLCELAEPGHCFRQHKVKNTIVFFGTARATSRDQDNPSPACLARYYDDAVAACKAIDRVVIHDKANSAVLYDLFRRRAWIYGGRQSGGTSGWPRIRWPQY